jgi:hypothetical protein
MEKQHNLNFDILDTSPISKPGNMGYFVWRKKKKKKKRMLGVWTLQKIAPYQ